MRQLSHREELTHTGNRLVEFLKKVVPNVWEQIF